MVPKGSTVEFIITRRTTDRVNIPNLVCKPYDEAVFLIESNNLAVGQIVTTLPRQEWSNSFVYRQEPAFVPNLQINMGTQITIYLSSTRPANCPDDVLEEASELEEQF